MKRLISGTAASLAVRFSKPDILLLTRPIARLEGEEGLPVHALPRPAEDPDLVRMYRMIEAGDAANYFYSRWNSVNYPYTEAAAGERIRPSGDGRQKRD